MIILVPLLFGTAMIGKLIDVRQTAVQASRYAAWESTVNDGVVTDGDVTARFFADRSSPVASMAAGALDRNPGGENALWGARGTPSTGVMEDTRVTVDVAGVSIVEDRSIEGPTAARTMGTVVVGAGQALSHVTGGDWELEADGLLRRGVTVPVENNGWLARQIGGCGSVDAPDCLQELSVIMTDDWSVGSNAAARDRARNLVPAGALRALSDLLSHAGNLPILKELSGLAGALGKVDVEALPASETGRRTLGDYDENERP